MTRNIDLALAAAGAAASKKADAIVVLDVSRQLVITDYFVICSGNTERQVSTVAEEVERRLLHDHGRKPFRREGERDARWVLLDYVDFVVHVFHRDERDYYNLERLWSDADRIPFVEAADQATAEASSGG